MVKLTLLEPITEKQKSFKAIAVANAVLVKGSWTGVDGKVLIYFKKDSAALSLQAGAQIISNAYLQPISNAGNPGEFDYKRYCLFQSIQQQVYLTSDHYIKLREIKLNWLRKFLLRSKQFILQTIQQNIPDKKEQSVAEALLIGYRDEVDKNLLEAYSNTGVVHIIVISGMHMGMIYGLAIWLITPFKKRKWFRFAKPVFVLSVIWFFAFITGARPSVLRVATMLSFLLIGEAMQRKHNVYNTLAASAFFLLLVNPFYLWDAGFQLSFAAVLSIITFYKPVYQWLHFKNKLVVKIWQLAAVTIAVQFFTLPLTLYHFHRFPVYFLFANFLAVPLACIILYLELLLMFVSNLKPVAVFIGKLIAFFISLMNNFIENTNRLPFSTVDNIYTDLWQTIILFIIIIAFSYWLLKKNRAAFFVGMTSLIFLIAIKNMIAVQDQNQKKLIIYNEPKTAAIDLIDGKKYLHLNTANNSETQSQQAFYLTPTRIFFHANEEIKSPNIYFENNLIQSNNKRIFILNRQFKTLLLKEKITVDAIIISQNPWIKISDILTTFNCSEIIADSSNPLWKIAQWSKQCDSLHLRFHSVSNAGAFVMDL